MLVDLARNDLQKVCEPGTVAVTEFMTVERFSHIMHLVSSVEGAVRADASAIDVFRATFPAGTLSGAPKPRALEINRRARASQARRVRGCRRLLRLRGRRRPRDRDPDRPHPGRCGRVQAGAGLVADSDPSTEHQEAVNKAAAPLRAVATANRMREVLS